MIQVEGFSMSDVPMFDGQLSPLVERGVLFVEQELDLEHRLSTIG